MKKESECSAIASHVVTQQNNTPKTAKFLNYKNKCWVETQSLSCAPPPIKVKQNQKYSGSQRC
ncbi:hypothetical protein [Nostoc sp. FACHB-280]|uniref:hypothetical protein n=1 Tax=Nostoc sp. FACHB-280 TaxID=2692839 RepID=UPI00168B640C|nr:hypothetical protein [Nostoc sp. FACHB-280]MBD2497242.1 hypothetical protein [Nostoc sp. FACHB-280]